MKSKMIIFLILCAFLSIPPVHADQSNGLSLDDKTLQRVLYKRVRYVGNRPSGLLVFRIIDSETNKTIDDAELYRKLRVDSYENRFGDYWKALWVASTYNSYKIVKKGYFSVGVDSIKMAIDSAVIVTIEMKKGIGTINVSGSGDSTVQVAKASLEGASQRNVIIGKIMDGSIGSPVLNASVYCEETDKVVTTDSSGEYIIELNDLQSVRIHVWHPAYDSIRFEINKDYILTPTVVDILFETKRRTSDGVAIDLHQDSTILLLVDMMDWWSWGMRPNEFSHKIYTYAVLPGEVFGPTPHWPYYDCVPFRLVRRLADKAAWVQFSTEFGLFMGGKTNFLFLSDTTVKLNTNSYDGGTTVSLSLQPDYSPRGRMKRRDPKVRSKMINLYKKMKIDSCDIIKAQVERVHFRNMLSLLEGDFTQFAKSVSDDYRHPKNTQGLSHATFFRKWYERKYTETFEDKQLLEIFDLHAGEVYVQGKCENFVNERFINGCKWRGFVIQEGDVYVYWPKARGDVGTSISVVYRTIDSSWKIVEMF